MKEERTITLKDIEEKAIAHSKQFDSDYQEQAYSDYYEGAEWVYDELGRVIANLRYDLHIARNGDPCKLPEGQTDKPEPFQSFPKDEIQFKPITKESYDGK